MSEITDYVDLTITINDAAPGEPNFGAMLIAGNSEEGDAGLYTISLTPNGIKAYTDTYGGETDDIVYKLLATIVGQTPHTNQTLWYNTKSALTDLVTITPLGPFDEGRVWSLIVNGTTIEHVGSDTVDAAEVATGLYGQADALTGVTAVDLTGSFTLAGTTASDNVFLDGIDPTELSVNVTDTSAGDISDALDAAMAINSDFYGVLIDVQDDTSIADAASWAETNRKMLFVRTKDKDVLTGGGILDTLFNAGYHRTALFYSGDDDNRLDAASLGRFLATTPGASDVQFKNHPGVTFDKLTASQISAIKAKNGITYTSTQGVRFTDNGVAVSGRSLAVTRNVDWLESRVQTAVLSELINSEIVPMSSDGIAQIEKAIRGVMIEAERLGVILSGWTVTAPKLSEISTTNQNNGLMPGFEFTAVTGKATRKVQINGTLV